MVGTNKALLLLRVTEMFLPPTGSIQDLMEIRDQWDGITSDGMKMVGDECRRTLEKIMHC